MYGGYPFWTFFTKFFDAVLLCSQTVLTVQIFIKIGQTVWEIYTAKKNWKIGLFVWGYPFWTFFTKFFDAILLCSLTIFTEQIFIKIGQTVLEIYTEKKLKKYVTLYGRYQNSNFPGILTHVVLLVILWLNIVQSLKNFQCAVSEKIGLFYFGAFGILYGGYPSRTFLGKFFSTILLYSLIVLTVQILIKIGQTVLEIYTEKKLKK